MKHLSEGNRSRYILVALFDRHDCIPEDDDTESLINRFRAFRQIYFVHPIEQLGDVGLLNKDDSDVKENATESIVSVSNLIQPWNCSAYETWSIWRERWVNSPSPTPAF